MHYETHTGFADNGRLADDCILKRLFSNHGKTVVDRTGLTGLFEADLQWTPDAPFTGAPETIQPYDPNGPSFTAAIREQLGLRLENRRDSVDVLVIDRIEHPTEN